MTRHTIGGDELVAVSLSAALIALAPCLHVNAQAVVPEVPENPAAPAPPTPPPPPAQLFTLVVKGLVTGTLFMQNAPMSNQGGGALIAPLEVTRDRWFLGGDVRQTRLTVIVKGPTVFDSAAPAGIVEFEFTGPGTQVTPVGGLSAVAGVRDPTTAVVTTTALPFNAVTNEPRSDESLAPRLRLAYLELSFASDTLRVGQYHHLLLGYVPFSASHIALPLGYTAGQLGFRAPGVTYTHDFRLGPATRLTLGVQVGRNSWRDELPPCGAQQTTAMTNCLPFGISVAEASALPQAQARVMLVSGAPSRPLPYYLPFSWVAFIAGHWDMKDLSGYGRVAPDATTRDNLHTGVVQAGVKTQQGPLLLALNAWYGRNAGALFGHVGQMQALPLASNDVHGFGAWSQLGIGLTEKMSLWAFAGIDKSNEAEAVAAGFTVLQNMQLAGQLAYAEGPLLFAAELLFVATRSRVAALGTTPAGAVTLSALQPSFTANYTF
jgi:hypothetical protein